MSYSASQSQSGQQTLIYINPSNASPTAFILIGEALSCTFSDKNMFDDSTNLQSIAKEFLAVLQDPGKLNVDLNRVSTDVGQVALQADFAAAPPNRSGYKIVMPINTAAGQSTRGDTYTFLGYVEQLAPDVKVDKKITSKFTVQITGPITFTLGA
jgi:hypothetical protein